MTFESAYGGWKRVTGRVLLGPESDYRLILGAPTGSSYYLNSIAIVRDDAMFDFQTAEERAAWEYIGNAHPTSWGIGGPGDFSGVVVGPSPSAGWSLRQRDIALEAQHSYEITYDVKHVHGDPATVNYMRVENLGSRAPNVSKKNHCEVAGTSRNYLGQAHSTGCSSRRDMPTALSEHLQRGQAKSRLPNLQARQA